MEHRDNKRLVYYKCDDDAIYLKICDEYLRYHTYGDVNSGEDPYWIYNKFLVDNGFGLIYVGYAEIDKQYIYEVMDERKWMLARIKYGI